MVHLQGRIYQPRSSLLRSDSKGSGFLPEAWLYGVLFPIIHHTDIICVEIMEKKNRIDSTLCALLLLALLLLPAPAVGQAPASANASSAGSAQPLKLSIDDAVRRGADVYVTGDVKYHDAQRAVEQGMHIIDAGHFGTEVPVLPVLAEQLRTELASERGEIEIFVTNTQRDVFDVII